MIPMALLCMVILFVMADLSRTWTRWNQRVQSQIDLDHCVGSRTLELKSTLEFLIARNKEIRVIRAAIIAATGNPALRSSLQVVLRTLTYLQETKLALWKIKQAKWLIPKCKTQTVLPIPLPSIPATRKPYADWVGTLPLSWTNKPLRIRLVQPKTQMSSASELEFNSGVWTAKWTKRWSLPTQVNP